MYKNIFNYWTKEKCAEEALKYKLVEDFRKHGNYAYVKSYKNNWLKDFYNGYIKPEIKWTKEECLKEASKYTNRNDFRKKSKVAYSTIVLNNWLKYLHFNSDKSPISYWSKDLCLEESKKYKTKKEFKKGSYQAYKAAYINCWLDEICEHMPKIGNLYKRCIYAFEFPDNNVYVGLTYNIDIREKQHYISSSSKVSKYYIESGLEPKLVKLTDYIDVNLAKIKEGEYIQNYRENNWCILNTQKAGNVGGNHKAITKEECKKEATKYIYLKDFRTEKPNIYKQIVRYKWYDACDFLIKEIPAPKVKWTKGKCLEEALKYNTKTDFEENNINAYNACVRNKWINELCNHMVPKVRKGGITKWTKEKCLEEASKYTSKFEFKKGSLQAYRKCCKEKWLKEI